MAAAHGFKPSIGHTEPKRGAEWWGKSVLLTFALFKSEPPSGRNPKWPLPQKRICTRSNPASWSAPRPPSGASPSHIWTGSIQNPARTRGRHRGQVESSHRPSHI
ncbi:hypothetical protein CUU62_27670 [Pseudomonas sp. WP001]|nr:hypothetical protein CUU62_27670 [Pseudomonas sp. WP001]